jgi:hypothetical protein
MQYADGEGQCGFFFSYDSVSAWDVENTWLMICISGCRQMKVTRISNIRKHGKHSGLMTDRSHHGWKQRWLQWHQAKCN